MAFCPVAKVLQDKLPEVRLQTTTKMFDEFVIKKRRCISGKERDISRF